MHHSLLPQLHSSPLPFFTQLPQITNNFAPEFSFFELNFPPKFEPISNSHFSKIPSSCFWSSGYFRSTFLLPPPSASNCEFLLVCHSFCGNSSEMEFAMESGLNLEQNTLINELTQGMELAKQLRTHLNQSSSPENRELLLQKILSSYEKALLILKWSGSMGNPQSLAPVTGLQESSVSGDGSPQSEDFDRGFKDHQEQSDISKKRKTLPTWTDHVRVCSENGIEGPMDDGYSWRKYGQKDILGAKYPRSYYRCTYRSTQNCWATKQVQRSDDDPTVFEMTYKGKHTCNQNHHTSPSQEKQQLKQNNNTNNHQQPPPENHLLFNLRTNLRVNTEELDNKEVASNFTFPHSASFKWMNGENQNLGFSTLVNDHTLGSYSPSFISPATSETNYYSVPPFQMNNFGMVFHHSESDIISANTSATNSPIGDLDFSIDPADLDRNFPFNTPGFFN